MCWWLCLQRDGDRECEDEDEDGDEKTRRRHRHLTPNSARTNLWEVAARSLGSAPAPPSPPLAKEVKLTLHNRSV